MLRPSRYGVFVSLLALAGTFLSSTAPAKSAQLAPDPSTARATPDSPAEASQTSTDEATAPSSTNLSAENDESSGTIIIIGSRIRRPDFGTPNPVISVGRDQIEESGTTNLTDFLAGYPSLQGSFTSSDTSGDDAGIGLTGINLLNLRNLGGDRTLVLVDGRRHVSGVPGSQAVDINTIPSDLIERVDVLTGGASAIYGADGVSGVVNFVLRRNFEGITARGHVGMSKFRDAGQRLFSVTAGHNFFEGRANAAVAYEHSEEDRLTSCNRPGLCGTGAIRFYLNPNDPENFSGYMGPVDNGIPDYVPLSDIRFFDSNREGGIDVDFDGFPDFLVGRGGQVRPFDPGLFVPDFFQQGGNGTLVSDFRNDLLPKIKRDVVNFISHFDVTDKITLFAEGKYAKNRAFSLAQPTFDFYLLIDPANSFLPGEALAANQASDACDDPDSPEFEICPILLTRDNFDLGQRGEKIERDTLRTVVGARGNLSDHLNYEMSYVYGRTKVTNHYVNDILTDRFYAALDAVVDPATGNVTCRINVDPTAVPFQPFNFTRPDNSGEGLFPPVTFQPGQCVPLNLFGEGARSQAALDFITADTVDHSRIGQRVLSGSVAGDLGGLFTFPGGESLGFALGAEYRKETSRFTPDPLAARGLTFTNSLTQDVGKFSVKEVFGEVRLPVFNKQRFAHKLELGGAVRFSDFSTIGSTTAWKVDGSYAPVRDIRFSGTYSTAVRAPNIGELFGGLSQTFNFITDPCNLNQLQNGTEFRAANCASLLSSLGADPATYRNIRATDIPGFAGGNPNLSEEKAKTWTAGVIFQPRFLPGLTTRFDWYDIRLKNAINTVNANQLAALCVDQPDLNNVFCQNITRQNGATGTADPGNIISFTVAPQNVAQFRTAGLDINLNYRVRTAWLGSFSLNVIGNYLDRLEFIGTPGAPVTNSRGEAFAPKYAANSDLTWKLGKLTVNYGLLWFSKTLRFDNQTDENNPDVVDPKYRFGKERWQHDMYLSVQAAQQLELYGGINNLFDQKPEIGTDSYPVPSVGRYFFAGARIKLDKIR